MIEQMDGKVKRVALELQPCCGNRSGIGVYTYELTKRLRDGDGMTFALCVLMLWFAAENLGVKKAVSAAICLVFVISPQIVWLSKSALTEMFHALIMCTFLTMITEPEYIGHRWRSAFMVTVFACFHVSIYVMLPMFLGIYWLLYFLEGDRQYIRGAIWSSLSFLAGFSFMTVVSPSYVTGNLFPVCHGPITPFNGWHFLMAAGAVSLIPSCLMPFAGKKGWISKALESGWANTLFRGLIVLMLGLALFYVARGLRENDLNQAVSTNGLYVFIWITGLVAIPAGVIYLLVKGSRVLLKAPQAAVVCMFMYAVLLMGCYMKRNISYCYYYSRYLGPYIPIACIMAGIAFNGLSGKALVACTAVSVMALTPFDYVLQNQLDDTYCSFGTLEKVMDSVSGQNGAVIISANSMDLFRQFALPLKSVGVRCYPQEEDAAKQFATLAKQHDSLFFIGNVGTASISESWLDMRLQEGIYLDDNTSKRPPFCPLPKGFMSYFQELSIYRVQMKQVFTPVGLTTTGRIEDNRIVLNPGELQYGP